MIRDWVNWAWLSGDIIVEQHIHHLDAMLWVLGKTPVKATHGGARTAPHGRPVRFLQHRLRVRRRLVALKPEAPVPGVDQGPPLTTTV